ncbi:putative Xaa-Pro aminopeptidase [Ceratocystis fimbriata CBS 114723]|uniref:Xaa-Pro aminopeptidase n=1 Tax=Ceratocystis fimbriata CBS 114723 TaxID=1035309 RepID=A0A2C5X9S6_9PEZI|nr:putative Xaa-Pro aminopeptidase [Ceratocystis fimbriata CBS 114723]
MTRSSGPRAVCLQYSSVSLCETDSLHIDLLTIQDNSKCENPLHAQAPIVPTTATAIVTAPTTVTKTSPDCIDYISRNYKPQNCRRRVPEVATFNAEAPEGVDAPFAKFPAKLHARKVADELYKAHRVSKGLIFLPGQPTTEYEDSDQGPRFRQRRYFFYITGANFPNCYVTYDIGQEHLILWVPYVEPRQVLWYGSTPSPEECLRKYDVDEVRFAAQLPEYLQDKLRFDLTLYLLHKDQAPHFDNEIVNSLHYRVNTSFLQECMDEARVIKTPYEVAMIRKACAISTLAHRQVAAQLLTLKNEREIEAVFQATCTASGARDQAYPIIAGSGVNASTLHYEENNAPLQGKELVVLDAGCEWNCYASDITRTLPISGSFSQEALDVYKVVDKMQQECLNSAKPGVLYYALHLHASRVALVELMDLGILHNGSAKEIWDAGTISAFFPHGLGHHVGLDVHDVSGRDRLLLLGEEKIKIRGYRSMKREIVTPESLSSAVGLFDAPPPPYHGRQALQPNMIVTIEPGIYFCREYIEGYFLSNPTHARFLNTKALERYYPVGGCRIEDDILIKPNGNENLTPAPKGQEMLDIINGRF